MRRLAALVVLFALGVAPAHASRGFQPPPLPGPRALQAMSHGAVLVELTGSRGAFAVQAAGGTLISSQLRIWRMPGAAAARLLPRLETAGVLRVVEPVRLLHSFARFDTTDPLVPTEWWIPTIGADTVVAPGPGVPVTMIDSALDVTHPEFAGRPNTSVLNPQTIVQPDDAHGTATSSVVGAPVNGIGLVGVYPQAVLRMWDASPGADLSNASAIQGILAASLSGRGVINMSFGGPDDDVLMAQAIVVAFGRGTISVASSGNSGADNGNPLSYPASSPHVITVAATQEDNTPAFFSSSSDAVDLTAPGVDIPVAVPLSINPTGYDTASGTSFSAPLVSGATAWVWTVRPTLEKTQVYDLMRWSAKDIGEKGWDKVTGFGLLNLPNALTQAPPTIDPQEPNDEIDQVKAGGLFPTAKPFVKGSFTARLDITDDPEDVYRVSVPAHSTVTATAKPNGDVDLELWGPLTRSVGETGAARQRDLLAISSHPGAQTEAVRWTNKGRLPIVAYADVYFPEASHALDASYTLSFKTVRAR